MYTNPDIFFAIKPLNVQVYLMMRTIYIYIYILGDTYLLFLTHTYFRVSVRWWWRWGEKCWEFFLNCRSLSPPTSSLLCQSVLSKKSPLNELVFVPGVNKKRWSFVLSLALCQNDMKGARTLRESICSRCWCWDCKWWNYGQGLQPVCERDSIDPCLLNCFVTLVWTFISSIHTHTHTHTHIHIQA